MYYTAYLALESGCYGQYQSAVTHGGSGILVNISVGLSLLEYAVKDT